MNNMSFRITVISAGIVIGAATAFAGEFMSGEAVEALFKGKTAKGVHLKKDYSYKVYFDPNGSITLVKANGDTWKGKWRVDDDGNHCVEWNHRDREFCKPVRDNGDGSYTKIKIKGSKEIPIVLLRDFTDGNNLGQ